MSWLGLASIRFTHSPEPVTLRTKDGKEKSFAELCRESTPSCWLNPLLFNGHLQTMWTAVKSEGPPIYYRRRIFTAESPAYEGTFAVDFAVKPHKDHDSSLPPRTAFYSDEDFARLGSDDDSRPMLIVLHGLSGGSYELYLREAIKPLLSSSSNWDICVVNARGCANSELTSRILFNGIATWDVRQVVNWAREKYPKRPLFGLGFSLGANILTNYVGETGAACPLSAAIAVGNPFNLEVANKALKRSVLGHQVYQRAMGSNLKRLLTDHKEALSKHSNLDFDMIEKVTYLYEIDRFVQCPTWGYPTEEAYYRDASSSDAILAIRIPYFAISAADDPIAVEEATPFEEIKHNPYAVLCSTSLGGHLSWFQLGGGRWHARPIVNFLDNMVSNMDLSLDRPVMNGALNHSNTKTGFDPLRRRMKFGEGMLEGVL